jgi:transposase-like protein
MAEVDVLATMTFPKDHGQKIYSTNGLERLNGEIKRRTEVVGIFPHASSPMKKRSSARSAPSARTERRMGRPARSLHDPGIRRALERRSHLATAHSRTIQPHNVPSFRAILLV